MSREIEPVQGSLRRRRSCAFRILVALSSVPLPRGPPPIEGGVGGIENSAAELCQPQVPELCGVGGLLSGTASGVLRESSSWAQ